MREPLRIGPDTRVTLHFTLRLAGGEVVDSTHGEAGHEKAPPSFLFGDGSLLPGFEQALLGLKAGDRRAVFVAAADGFGERNPENVQRIDRARFAPGTPLAAGLVLSFADKGGELPGVVTAYDDDAVTVDFNHPLAGRDLSFEVEIIAVESHVSAQPVALRDPRSAR